MNKKWGKLQAKFISKRRIYKGLDLVPLSAEEHERKRRQMLNTINELFNNDFDKEENNYGKHG